MEYINVQTWHGGSQHQESQASISKPNSDKMIADARASAYAAGVKQERERICGIHASAVASANGNHAAALKNPITLTLIEHGSAVEVAKGVFEAAPKLSTYKSVAERSAEMEVAGPLFCAEGKPDKSGNSFHKAAIAKHNARFDEATAGSKPHGNGGTH